MCVHGEGNGTPLQSSCLENPVDGGACWAAVHGVAKGRTGLSDFTFAFQFHALEKEMAPHSSVLAWRIPWTVSWQVTVHGVAKNQTGLSDKHFHFQSYLRKRQRKRDIGPSLCLLESKKGALPASGGRRASLSPETGNSGLRSLFSFFLRWVWEECPSGQVGF